jgi:hypothetical protein
MGNLLYRYLIVIVACISLLIGLQIPNFVNQYEKRVDAHLRKASADLQPFLDIAKKSFRGNLDILIEQHRVSDVRVFQEEGIAIENFVQQEMRFEADMGALKTNLPMKMLNIIFHGDHEVVDEVLAQYNYSAPMNEEALVFSSCITIAILFMIELLITLVSIARMEISRSLRRISPTRRYI